MTLRQQIATIKFEFFKKLDKILPEDFDIKRFCLDKDYVINAEAQALIDELKNFDFQFETDWYGDFIAIKRGQQIVKEGQK